MLKYNKQEFNELAKELNVVRDTLEKVYRLTEVLRFISSNNQFKNMFALKGGTALNLILFNLPRLSVDIDLDFTLNCSRDEMFSYRDRFNFSLNKFMISESYSLNELKSKNTHSLESLIYDYLSLGGNKDNIKIEPNYSLRAHLLPIENRTINSLIDNKTINVNIINPIEIIATKTVALLTRSATRDLYDMNFIINNNFIKENELELYRKCVIFYFAISTDSPIFKVDTDSINNISQYKVLTDLVPVVRNREVFNLSEAKHSVCNFLKKRIYFTENDINFLNSFKNGYYHPEYILNGEMLNNVINHPMALWKTSRNREDYER